MEQCPLPGRAGSMQGPVCVFSPQVQSIEKTLPKISDFFLALSAAIEAVLLIQKMGILLRVKNALSKEGEEGILVLGMCSCCHSF